jgi:hypothetical protein
LRKRTDRWRGGERAWERRLGGWDGIYVYRERARREGGREGKREGGRRVRGQEEGGWMVGLKRAAVGVRIVAQAKGAQYIYIYIYIYIYEREAEREREREAERERERERERGRERQREREKGGGERQRQRERGRERDRDRDRERQRETERPVVLAVDIRQGHAARSAAFRKWSETMN